MTTEIIGHDEALRHLLALDAHKAQSLLLEGVSGIGKKSIAMLLAAKILGVSNLSEAHPDFFLLEKSVDKNGKEKAEIGVDDARQLAKFLSLTPAQSEFRVALLDSADRLGTGAANSILKIVEEPPRNSIIILLAHEGAVLPTIRSRCQRILLRPLEFAHMQQVLQHYISDVSDADMRVLAEIAEGSPGKAIELYQHQGLDIIRELGEIFANPQKATYDRLARFAEKIAKSDKIWAIFKLILAWLINKLAKTSLYGSPAELFGQQIKAKHPLSLANYNSELNRKIEECEVFNMDKKTLIITVISDILRLPNF